ncbi:MAG: F0F1 ATP synthase subunit B [Acidobacteriota bacterium]|jgi:F-type H+-transporting ATPase subunit b
MDNPLVQVDPGLAIWTIVVFLVLLFLLKKFAWGPLLNALEARQERIQKSLDDAQKAQQELERLNRESAEILKQARVEAEAIVSKSYAESEKLRDDMKQKAREESEAIIRDARSQIETETGKALRQIRSEIADMSVMIASKLIQRNFTKEDNNELIEETLKQIESDSRPN